MDTTPRLNLPYLAAQQAQKHVTLNEALGALDAIIGLALESRTTSVQPASPINGDAYLVPSGASGDAWAGLDADTLIVFRDGAWTIQVAPAGLIAWVRDEQVSLQMTEAGWAPLAARPSGTGRVEAIGIAMEPDDSRPLSMSGASALLTAQTAAEGGDGDIRLTLNREMTGGNASVVFQSGYSGRAEIGLTGSDALSFRTSADGSSFDTRLRLSPAGEAWFHATANFSDKAATPDMGVIVLAESQRIYGGALPASATSANWIEFSPYGFWNIVQAEASVLQVSNYWVHAERKIDTTGHYEVDGIRVVGPQQPALADLDGSASLPEAVGRLNDVLATLRTHGLIAS